MAGKRLFATPISEVRSPRSDAVVGWVYRWNTGEEETAWLEEFPLWARPPVDRAEADPDRMTTTGPIDREASILRDR